MNEQALQAIVDKVVREIKAPQDMTLDIALSLAEKVKAKAVSMGVKAVVAISGRAGRPVLVQCMDDSYIASYDVAVQKAFTVVALKMSTSTLKPLAQPGGSLYGIQFTNSNKIVIFGGGEPVMDGEHLVGGVGVSGGTEEEDTFLGEFAAKVAEEELRCQQDLK